MARSQACGSDGVELPDIAVTLRRDNLLDASAMPLARATSVAGFATYVGVLVLFHQLLTVRLNLSPAITLRMMAGPIFCRRLPPLCRPVHCRRVC